MRLFPLQGHPKRILPPSPPSAAVLAGVVRICAAAFRRAFRCADSSRCVPPRVARDAYGAGMSFLTVGHRGVMGVEPENTLRSFRRAEQAGLDQVELDLHLSKDGAL